MAASLLSVLLRLMYAGDQYLLQDRHKTARVKPTVGCVTRVPFVSTALFVVCL